MYVCFTEYNKELKETWNFYFPVKDNMETIDFLSDNISAKTWVCDITPSSQFCFDDKKRYSEKEVDVLVEGCQKESGGFVKSHIKLQGVCSLLEKFMRYQETEIERYVVWNLTTRPMYWQSVFEEWPENQPTSLARLTFSDSS